MPVIGYLKARNLMRQLEWKLLVTMDQEMNLLEAELYHPKQANRYKVRRDSAKKLMAECRVVGRKTHETAILCYDHSGSDETLI